MKAMILMTVITFTFGGFSAGASDHEHTETVQFKVSGSCGMCKSRIEEAAMVEGVVSAVWDMKTKVLTVEYNSSTIKLDAIHQNIADAGHDTEKVKADDRVYESLPACCKYPREDASSG